MFLHSPILHSIKFIFAESSKHKFVHQFIYSIFYIWKFIFPPIENFNKLASKFKNFLFDQRRQMIVLNVKMLVPLMILLMMVFIIPAAYVDPSSYHLECYASIQHGDEKNNYTTMDCGDSVRVFKCGKVTCKGPDKISSLNINLEIFIFFSGTWLFCTLLMIIR